MLQPGEEHASFETIDSSVGGYARASKGRQIRLAFGFRTVHTNALEIDGEH